MVPDMNMLGLVGDLYCFSLSVCLFLFQYSFERPETRPDTKNSEREILYEGSVNIVQQIIKMCEDKYNELITPRQSRPIENKEVSVTLTLDYHNIMTGYTELGAGDPVWGKREYCTADYKDVWG